MKLDCTSLKILSLNCQSIRSTEEELCRFRAMVYEHLPDIIIGCQSQIDNWYNSAEVFPADYCVFMYIGKTIVRVLVVSSHRLYVYA